MSALESRLGDMRAEVRGVFDNVLVTAMRRAIFATARAPVRARAPQGARRQKQLLARHVARLGQMDEDDRAIADRRPDPNRAAMQIDERARDGKTKTRALHAIVEGSIHLFEGPAKPCQRRRRNAHSGIFHIDIQSPLNHPRADADAAVIGREFDRVAQEDRENLFNRLAVGIDVLARQGFGDEH